LVLFGKASRTFGFHENTEFPDQMNNYQLLKEDATWDTEDMAYFNVLEKSTKP
jgi:hypothetical protein